MDVDKFSPSYRLICRFFKEIGLYKEFLDYQRYATSWEGVIQTNATNAFRVFGNSSITNWIKKNKHIYPKRNFYESFKLWVNVFYPLRYDDFTRDYYVREPSEDGCLINKNGKKITIEYEQG